ncbi:MAG: PLP-dependent aminotransferase family protein [Blautia sp.]|nr:PLP-dependent aminotransferase family protein [Blautia sp.]
MGHLYIRVYEELKQKILSGEIPAQSRMPSLRKYSMEKGLSRTTVENAYLQLAAEGYILAKPQSGYYVTSIKEVQNRNLLTEKEEPDLPPVRFDFASSGVDRQSFRFDLWQRYLKSALRQDDRLLSYGEPQGEADFRESLSEYVRSHRNIYCSPESIVVGAGVQSLLWLLCPLLLQKKARTVSFPTPYFLQGSTIFTDYGFETHVRDKDCDVIYVSPAHMTRWGEVMSGRRRLELLSYSEARGSLVIEDDIENEFIYHEKPAPSLYSLSKAQNVVYIGSFSRLLLPSIRISYMILPPALLSLYKEKAARYNQTASKAEQIALSQFIRDGHLGAQIRRLRRLYAQKLQLFTQMIGKIFGPECPMKTGAAGTSIALTIPCALTGKELSGKARNEGLTFRLLDEAEGNVTVILSFSSMPSEDFEEALLLLKKISQNKTERTP